VPIDIWLGRRDGWEVLSGLGFQAGWGALLLLACAAVLRLADRKVVVQGG
jgi:ABC-2 type transport system permease protein